MKMKMRMRTPFKEADTISMLPKGEDEMLVQYIEENLGGKIPAIYDYKQSTTSIGAAAPHGRG